MEGYVLRKALRHINLGGLRTFSRTGSTNDVALAWAAEGAPDLSLIYAEEQTAGRGRGNHRWYTFSGTALAFSLILRPFQGEIQSIPLFSGLGAMAVCDALEKLGLNPEIKWPNDVLLASRKTCGVLAESIWMGGKVDCIVLGIGVNVKPKGIPPDNVVNYPATSIETELRLEVDRLNLLIDILKAVVKWRKLLTKEIFIRTWENHLAYRGRDVMISVEGYPAREGIIDGLEENGNLRIKSHNCETFTVQYGEVHLQPVL
jgi:BirA family biotin operon repressor/biotin-[acetyl-CoA-carboxylase] ligase